MTNNDKAIAALERVLSDARYGIGSNDHEVMNEENYKKEMAQHSEDSALLRQAITAPPVTGGAWLPIDSQMTGNFVVTNNLHAKDATGKMSHIWYTSFIQESSEPNKCGKYICFDEADRKIHGLTHYYKIAPPSSAVKEGV